MGSKLLEIALKPKIQKQVPNYARMVGHLVLSFGFLLHCILGALGAGNRRFVVSPGHNQGFLVRR